MPGLSFSALMGQSIVLRGPRGKAGASGTSQGAPSLSSASCLQIRQALELRLGCPLQQYRDFIDNQMLLLMAQQDRASRIFPHLYLVSCRLRAGRWGLLQLGERANDALSVFTGLRVERSEPGGAAEKQVGFRALPGLSALCLPPWGNLARNPQNPLSSS